MELIKMECGKYYTDMGEYFKIINGFNESPNKQQADERFRKVLKKSNVIITMEKTKDLYDETINRFQSLEGSLSNDADMKNVLKEIGGNSGFEVIHSVNGTNKDIILYFNIKDEDFMNFRYFIFSLKEENKGDLGLLVYYLEPKEKHCNC